jgi:hypothetical protein
MEKEVLEPCFKCKNLIVEGTAMSCLFNSDDLYNDLMGQHETSKNVYERCRSYEDR